MPDHYKHLVIEREKLNNNRRTTRRNIPRHEREDISAHSQKIFTSLNQAIINARLQISSTPNNYILKLNYTGHLDFTHLHKHGVEFISQEDQQMCIVFSSEDGLTIFADHIQRLGLNDSELTYKQILEALDGIDNWTEEDRTSWALKNKGFPAAEKFSLDIELWPLKVTHHPERNTLCTSFEQWLQTQNIAQLDKVNLDSLLMYRVQVSEPQAKILLNHKDIRLVDLTPATGISYQQQNRDINEVTENISSPRSDASKICILDSGINTNHPLLAPAIAESASFIENEDESDDVGHGTAVASIALYGDLESCNSSNSWVPSLWLYNGKLMYRCPDTNEAIFDNKTIEKTITNAVNYFVDLGCRIFNLSIGNANAPYDGSHIRGIAYVLDNLARQYNILFVVSTGNFSGNEDPPIPQNSWRDEYPEYLLCKESSLIDPAPALNVLTVGSLAKHNRTSDAQRYEEISQLSPASENQPSPFTRHGPSIKGALKPELVATGGNLANPIRQQEQWQIDMRGLGVLTCHHGFFGSTLFKEMSGTSFSAPYITHLAGRFLNEYPNSSANLIRAMLINHANLEDDIHSTFSDAMRSSYKEAPKTRHREIARDVSGYGMVDEDALFRSSENAVVLMSEDSIENNAHQFFELPLPREYLRPNLATRELRVTLAYSPAVRTTRLDYVATRINYRLIKGDSLEEVQAHFNQETQSETETRNDDATSNRTVSSQLRDKGTVQSSYWKFRRRNPNEKWFIVVTRQDRDWGEALSLELEPYALVATVTDRENEEAQLYTQISQRIIEQEKVREQVQIRQ